MGQRNNRRDCGVAHKSELIEILEFTHFFEHFTFEKTDWSERGKHMKKYEFLDDITEIRTCCGFRENLIQVANKPFDVSRLELACLLIS